MLESLSIVMVPLFLGYLFKITRQSLLILVNRAVMWLMFIILFVMGVSLGQLDDLLQKLPTIGITALIFSVVIHLCNISVLAVYDRKSPQPLLRNQKDLPSRLHLLMDSLKLCAMVLIGFIVGLVSKGHYQLPLGSSTYVLVCLIFLVGVQLRNNGISLRQVFFNKAGIYTAFIFIFSSLLGGIIAALLLSMPISQGLALSAGMGWYSLSSVLINDQWGPILGSIAFFNDLSREIFSLFVIPFFMQRYRATAIGIAGATALDCTLPVIQRSGGIDVVPFAISFGFIVNIAVPILLAIFINIPI